MAQMMDGKRLADHLCTQLAQQIQQQAARPCLAVVMVGDQPASHIYVRNKTARAQAVGIHTRLHHLPCEVTTEQVVAVVRACNQDPRVHGILVQLPLPTAMDTAHVIEAIDPNKDVDGFHPLNLGRLASGIPEAIVPCTPQGCWLLVRQVVDSLSGLHAVIVGRSNIVGKPMGLLLLREHCTVTFTHSKTRDVAAECQRADLVVAAIGQPQFIRGDWIKPGAIVIDVGINRVTRADGTTYLVGDVDPAAADHARAMTPVPGGVGPMTVACLLWNTWTLACRQQGLPSPDVALFSQTAST